MAEDKGPQGKSDVALREEAILKFWQDNTIFEKSLQKDAPQGEFVFYDGPPFATGLPHAGSLLSSVSKDLIPRYKTMRGYFVRRRWGWDTHGLPIESLVEKKLGLKNKRDILDIGVEKFNETARSMVLEYVGEWKRYVERVGRWVDFDNSYKTMDATYTESVWWALKQIHEKGNLYEGRKVLMYCPHCETPLAKAEIAMDNTYKDVTEEAVTIKFKLKDADEYLLAWTTTPWTLPGNVALAVGVGIDYVKIDYEGSKVWLAKERLPHVAPNASILEEQLGNALVGREYEPLYAVEKVKNFEGKKWVVLPADFVTTTDGTGIVHTAVIYGEDDYQLGVKESLPMVPILNANATYNKDAPEFVQGEYIKKAEAKIKDDLTQRGLLFSREQYTHSYPHCYRCGTALIYNAVPSWFINVQKIKDQMLSENEKVSWFPEHLKEGRFRKNLESAPDWTISRNRFWASPLPFWKDADGNVTVIGSLDELKSLTKKSGNTYHVVRHGQAEHNVQELANSDRTKEFHLTRKGIEEAQAGAASLKGKKIDLIVASPFLRTKETAAQIAEVLGLSDEVITYDDRLGEFQFGDFDGKPIGDFLVFKTKMQFDTPNPNGESYLDATKRFGEFIYELERTHSGKNILIVTHGIGLETLQVMTQHIPHEHAVEWLLKQDFKTGEPYALDFVPVPHNRNYELDYHLPYIDEVQLEKEGKPLTRVPEVVDCWLESGSMPFAEYHYPFENKSEFEKRTPGDFVSEYIGQTRAWFYYMHVVGVQLFGQAPFKHVTTTGTVLAADGEKISKSKKNYTDPYLMFDLYGADAFRYYLMSSVVMQAEDLNFRDEEVKEVHGRVVNILRNTLTFYQLYQQDRVPQHEESKHVLDQWILNRMNQLIAEMTLALDAYDVIRASRPIKQFVEDFSTWYVRRSRDRVKSDDAADKQAALNTMHMVLEHLARLCAPIMPFIAEEIYQVVRSDTDQISVHLAEWPTAWAYDPQSMNDMTEVHRVVSLALEARSKANIKVRQPLQTLKINAPTLEGKSELLALIKDEMNVKEVVVDTSIESVVLDTTITPELKEEGELRDLIREIQDLRKQAGLMPKDKATLSVPGEKVDFVKKYWTEISKAANLSGTLEGSLNVTKA